MSDKPFSKRTGFTQPKPVQINDLDKDARTALHNAYLSLQLDIPYDRRWECFNVVATRFLKMKADRSHSGLDQEHFISVMDRKIENIFLQSTWYKSFDFIEFFHRILTRPEESIVSGYDNELDSRFSAAINQALEQENVGWKFSKGLFVPVQPEEEQKTIERALNAPFARAQNHIEQSLVLLSIRPTPDYANSIKESISAVESICEEITGKKRFSAAVDKLGISMHPAFKEAAKKLYGFTSDEAGIRHAATGEPMQVNQATARYMLIVCSAMVNFIIAQKSGAE